MSKFKLIPILAAVATGATIMGFGLSADAQSRKKDQVAQPSTGHQSCNGLLWIGSRCQLPDGRVCDVAEGTSGNAVLRDCK